jgi:uncharacterized protein (TIGR03118 family)
MRQRMSTLMVFLGLMLVMACSSAWAQYQLTNLVSNQAGKATHKDPLLTNAWGLAYAPGNPIWVSDNQSGWSTLYDGVGNPQSLQVIIPAASLSGKGTPTGMVYNGSQEFKIHTWTSLFLFATLDGTISGWSSFNPSAALIAVTQKGAVYTGLAITSKATGNHLFAADSANNKVDVYDGNFNLVKSFTDPTLPKNFTPFGIQDIKGKLYVAFADSTGGSGGFIDVFKEDGTGMKRLIQGAPLNQPWGIALAPLTGFGPLSGTLLVTNNINTTGTINGFNLTTGKLVGTMMDTKGKPIQIDQLWGIKFGGGSVANGKRNQLYFTAGPNNNVNGTLGVIVFK